MRHALLIAVVVLVAGCGEGNRVEDGNGGAVTGKACGDGPSPEILSELEQYRLLAESIHERLPDVPRWIPAHEQREGERNGTRRLVALGRRVGQWRTGIHTGDGVRDWERLRTFGLHSSREWGDDVSPDIEDVLRALKESAIVANEMKSLRHYDRLPVMILTESGSDIVLPWLALLAGVHRVELLLAAGLISDAKRELGHWIEVVQKVDGWNSRMEAVVFRDTKVLAVSAMAHERNRAIHGDDEFIELMNRLRDDYVSGFWTTFKNELAYAAHMAAGEEEDILEYLSAPDLRAARRYLRGSLAVVDRFGSPPMDPLDADVFATMKAHFLKYGDLDDFVFIEHEIYETLRLQAYWLTLELRQMDAQSPLIDRIDSLHAKAAEYEGIHTSVRPQTGKVELSISPDLPIRDLSLISKNRSLVEFQLQLITPDGE